MRRKVFRFHVWTAELRSLPAVHAVQLGALHEHLVDAFQAKVVPTGEQLRHCIRIVERQVAAAAQDQFLQLRW